MRPTPIACFRHRHGSSGPSIFQGIATSIAAAAALLPIAALPQQATARGSDLCERAAGSYSSAPEETLQSGLDHEVAVYVVKHLQRACRRLNDFARSAQNIPSDAGIKAGIDGVAARLHAEVLEPIYRHHPDLRGQDLTGQGPDLIERDTTPGEGEVRRFGLTLRLGQLEREHAVRLEHALSNASAAIMALGTACAKDADPTDREQITRTALDIVAELNFATSPVYASFPDLWDEKLRGDRSQILSRTADGDAAFRKEAPAPGAVHVSPAVVAQAREFLKGIEQETGSSGSIIALIWTKGMEEKGPNDGAWKSLGPRLTMGNYYREQVPPDVIRMIEDVPFVFVGNGTVRFEGKLIDFRDGKLVLVDL